MLDLIITLAAQCDRCGHLETSAYRDSWRAHEQLVAQGWTFDCSRPDGLRQLCPRCLRES